jgi:4-alpha-glucanotransferase
MNEPTNSQSANPTRTDLAHRRSAGVLVPVFSLRREGGLGIGDVTSLKQLVDWAAETGLGFIQLLPINETGSDNSPYNAISSVAIDPLTLDCSPQRLPDLSSGQYSRLLASSDEEKLRDGKVHYEMVRLLKLELLWRAFQMFFSVHYKKQTGRDTEFHVFCERERRWLGDYCLFRLLMDMEGGKQNWQSWNEEYNTIDKAREHLKLLLAAEPMKTERQLVFYAYTQWIAQAQWAEVRDYAEWRGVALMGDMPIGVALCSADVFANPEWFDLEWFGGAPPETNFKDDEFTQKWGQNWGIPLYRWDRMEVEGFSWWRQRVAKMCEVFSMFRIDHALGFFRIYSFPWNPLRNAEFLALDEEQAREKTGGDLPCFHDRDDDSEENQAANRERGMRFLRMIKEAAGDAVVIAEDLGVVPDYVGPALAGLGIAGMKVPPWEVREHSNELVAGSDYPETSFATYATHDHLPLRIQWERNRDIVLRGDQESREYWEAWRFLHGLSGFAAIGWEGETPPDYGDGVRESLLKALLASRSRHVGILITDLFGMTERINTPGVAGEQNWTWRIPYSASALGNDPDLVKRVDQVKKLLKECDRVPRVSQTRDERGLYEI